MPDQQLSLSEYLETVQEIVKIAFGDPVWVGAVKGPEYSD